MKPSKGILINAETQEVSEIEINIWSEIAPAIGCDLFDVIYIDDKNVIYTDDEGLLKRPENFIAFEGYPQPLAGSLLVLGTTPDGDSCDTSLTIEEVRDKIRFLNRLEAYIEARANHL